MEICSGKVKRSVPADCSVINASIIAGVIPIYVSPGFDEELDLPLGVAIRDLIRTIKKNLDAKTILINHPTYYGICSDLDQIVEIGHKYNMLVLVDEAHGTHNYFHDEACIKKNAHMDILFRMVRGGCGFHINPFLLYHVFPQYGFLFLRKKVVSYTVPNVQTENDCVKKHLFCAVSSLVSPIKTSV